MWHPNAPAPDGPASPDHVGPQAYPQGSQVDPWAQTWVRPVGDAVGHPPAATPWPPRQAPGFASPPPAVLPPPPPGMPGWPPGYPMSAPRGNARRKWALVGGVSAAVVAVTVCTGVLIAVADKSNAPAATTSVTESGPPAPSTTTTAAKPPPIVPIDALPGLLLDPAVVNGIEGTSAMVVRPDPHAGSGSGFADIQTDRPECQGIQHPAMLAALQGSGWLAAQTQVLREPADDWTHLVSNAVVDFPNAQLAGDYAAKQEQAWAKCSGKPLTSTAVGENPVTWSVGTTSNRDGTVNVLMTQEGAAGWGCERALTVRNNIVIDTRSCGFFRTDQAITIAAKIADRVHTPNQ